MVLINTVLILFWWHCLNILFFFLQWTKTLCVLFWHFIFFTFILAQCIRAIYMHTFPTKVKSFSIEYIISIIYNFMWAKVSTAQVLIKIEVRITDPSPANQLYEWISREYYASMYIVPQKFGAVVVFCTIEVSI